MGSCLHYIATKIVANTPIFVMIFIQCVYAGMVLLSKAAMSKGMSPYVFVVYRQGIASIVLAPFAYFIERKKAPPLSYSLNCKIFVISLIGITISLNLYAFGITFTTATVAAATNNTVPAITFIIAVILRMERLNINKLHGVFKVLGSLLGLSGAFVYAFVKGPSINFMHKEIQDHLVKNTSHSKGDEVKGFLLMMASNATWSLWLIMQGPIVKEYPAKLRLAVLQCFFSCIQSAVWGIAMEKKPSAWKIGWDLQLITVLYCAIVVTGLTYWLQIWTIQKKGAVFTAAFTPLNLIITVIFSAIIWKETNYAGSVGGAVLLIVGLYFCLWAKNKEAKSARIADEQNQERKEETQLESIITH